MKKKIVFHNELAELYPEGIEVEGDSAWECLSGLQGYPGLNPSEHGKRYRVLLPDFRSRDAMKERTARSEIHVYGVLAGGGGGGGGWLMVAIGVLLIVAAPYIAPALGGAFGATSATISAIAGKIATIGFVIAAQGVISLFSPAPNSADGTSTSSDGKSLYLPADKNTTKVGTPIALILGRCIAYGQILSFNVSATNMNSPTEITVEEFSGGLVGAGDDTFTLTTYNDWSI